MPFHLSILVLGDSSLSVPMVQNSNLEPDNQDDKMSIWKKSINRGFDRAEIELKIPLSSKNGLDMEMHSADGKKKYIRIFEEEKILLMEFKY